MGQGGTRAKQDRGLVALVMENPEEWGRGGPAQNRGKQGGNRGRAGKHEDGRCTTVERSQMPLRLCPYPFLPRRFWQGVGWNSGSKSVEPGPASLTGQHFPPLAPI